MGLKTIGIAVAATLAAHAADRKQLFNGRDLDGWSMVGPGRFTVEDGALKTEGGMGLLWYARERFGDATIRVVYKTAAGRGNSGVFIRLAEEPKDPWYAVHNGYEVQVESAGDDWHTSGSIYSLSKVTRRTQRPTGEWNTMEIKLDGDITVISLNGAVVNEFDPSRPVPERKMWYEPVRGPRAQSGFIGLQNHDAASTVYFREVSVAKN